MTKHWAIAAVLLLLLGSATAQDRVECNRVPSKSLERKIAYCALLPPGYDANPAKKFPVLYFLHGMGGDHEFLVSSGGWNLVEQLREHQRIGEFVIITPAAGSSFYINSKDGRARYEDFFIREFMPAMERRFRLQGTRAGRAIGGISMGGYGAMRFAFKYPQLFASVSAHSAALSERLPKGIGWAAGPGGGLLGTAFGSPLDGKFWQANSPFVFARTSTLRNLKIYFDVGQQDDYGFDAGGEAMHQLLTSRNIPHEFHIYPGHHDWLYFSEHLHQSLEFHSKAFGLTR